MFCYFFARFQTCKSDKEHIEFVKNGLDMVVKKGADDHAKKLREIEKRSEKAFESLCTTICFC